MVWLCAWRALASCITVCAWANCDWMSSMVCWPGCGVKLVAMLWLSAEIWAAELGPVGEAVKAANTAIDCNCERIADSLACAPYCTEIDESICALADDIADPGPEFPVYHCTVLAEVPATSDVAELSGVPLTRNGGTGAVM